MDEWLDPHAASLLESLSYPDIFHLQDPDSIGSSQAIDSPGDIHFERPPRNDEPPRNIKERPIKFAFRRLHSEPNHKVAIPRENTTRSRSNRARVFQACRSCQELKTKCSGHRPICQRCEELEVECKYGERKREVTTKKIEDLSSQVHILESLLRGVYPMLDTESAKGVDELLQNVRFVCGLSLKLEKILVPGQPSLARLPVANFLNTSKYPFAMPDCTQEDFNRESGIQATGFIGEHSAMAWLYRLKSTLEQDFATESNPREQIVLPSISSIDYYRNGCEMNLRENLNLYERLEHSEANQLISIYFRVIHPSFPIIGKTLFLAQYRSFYSSSTARPGKQWLAVLNFIFAIATTNFSPTREINSSDEQARLASFSRAWILSIDKTSLRDHSNLQQVQAEGLAAFYLLSIGQVNRSWKSCGIAIRSALAMGLNLRNESKIPPLSKEIRYRVWWALYVLDSSLSGLTGRPPSVSRGFCTTPLPIPFEEEGLHTEPCRKYLEDKSARRALDVKLLAHIHGDGANEWTDNEFLCRQGSRKRTFDEGENTAVLTPEYPPLSISLSLWYERRLSIITNEAIETIYAPSGAQKQWVNIELAISSLNAKVDVLIASLPASYAFHTTKKAVSSDRHPARLAFQSYHTKILITQPCLRQLMHTSEPPNSLELSNESMPGICIQAAVHLIGLLPDQPNLTWLYGLFPWWSVLQYIIQAMTIMLTGSFLWSTFGALCPFDVPKIAGKAQEWLKELCKVNVSARKAWLMFSDLISSHAQRLGFPDL